MKKVFFPTAIFVVSAFLFSACGSKSYTVGGTLSGLTAGTKVVLRNSGGEELALTADGAFSFGTKQVNGSVYDVDVIQQPAGETCTLANSAGVIKGVNVTNIVATCATRVYSLGGTMVGLLGSVVLNNNGGEELITLSDNGTFTFNSKLANGSPYNITVEKQPYPQTCSVANGNGKIQGQNVSNVWVTCSVDAFTVGGTLNGLNGTVRLTNNGTDDLTLNANGSFRFLAKVANGSEFNVDVATQPPLQTCTIANGHGIVSGADVTDVAVTCSASTFSLGGTLGGLVGTLVLINNNDEDNLLTLTANGPFTFPAKIADGSVFNVKVKTAPTHPSQTCTITNGYGTVNGADITSVVVACSTNSYSIGGTITGIPVGSPAPVILTNNSGDDLAIDGDGFFTFATKMLDGSAYDVNVKSQPSVLTCTVAYGHGNVDGENVLDIEVTCSVNTYFIGGTLSGLDTGRTIVLENTGEELLSLTSNGAYKFTVKVADGMFYHITVATMPDKQVCTLLNEYGQVSGADVTNVNVTCEDAYTIGGTISGLGEGEIVELQNNGGDNLELKANGTFTFNTKVTTPFTYKVTIHDQPYNQYCTVTAGSGTASDNVNSVVISCTDNKQILALDQKYSGNLGGIAGADAICVASFGAGFKALIVDENNRRACTSDNCSTGGLSEHKDWVLKPNTAYTWAIGGILGVTNQNGIFIFPLKHGFTLKTYMIWTGLNPAWKSENKDQFNKTQNCSGWTVNDDNSWGAVGFSSSTRSDAISSKPYPRCNQELNFLCVEQ